MPTDTRSPRRSTALPTPASRRRYTLIMVILVALGLTITAASLGWANPLPVNSHGFWAIAGLRSDALLVILTVSLAQAVGTVAFQTVTNNRILTPSIMGFESLYRLIQTLTVFVLGIAGAAFLGGTLQFVGQIVVMVIFAVMLYGTLLTGRRGNLQITLLVGLVLGGGLASVTTFLERLLDPAEFDILLARQIASIAKADTAKLSIAIPVVVIVAVVVYLRSRKLNVLALGRDISMNLGVNHQRFTIEVLVLVAILISVSTALIGPMTFFGFLVAMITYQLADTYDHRLLLPMSVAVGFDMFAAAHLVLKRVFYAEGSVGIIIEIVGGTFFLVYILRKGRLA